MASDDRCKWKTWDSKEDREAEGRSHPATLRRTHQAAEVQLCNNEFFKVFFFSFFLFVSLFLSCLCVIFPEDKNTSISFQSTEKYLLKKMEGVDFRKAAIPERPNAIGHIKRMNT